VKTSSALARLYRCLALTLTFLLILASTPAVAQDIEFPTPANLPLQGEDVEATRGGWLVGREQYGITRVLSLNSSTPSDAGTYSFVAADQMLVSKIFFGNGLFSSQEFNTAGVGLATSGGIFHEFYLSAFERQEHTFDPPLLIEPGASLFVLNSNGTTQTTLTIVFMGTVDPEVFGDRFEEELANRSAVD
jgi:hypothetical protein